MELYFLRHGIATPKEQGGPDGERPLVAEGIRKTQIAAEALRKLEINFDRILTSPLVRARQTADIVANALQAQARLEELDELAGEPVKDLVRALAKFKGSERLLLVGHQTQMGDAIAYLLGAKDGAQVDLKKSGICMIEVDSMPPKSPATLRWMLSPKHMNLMT